MQRLENCLSGYYAAYGSYPPVKLHGSRDYTLEVDEFSGIQNLRGTSTYRVRCRKIGKALKRLVVRSHWALASHIRNQ